MKVRQSVAVIGQRRVGKSSLAQQFIRRINSGDGRFFGFRFQVHENIASPSVFATRLVCEFLHELVKREPKLRDFDPIAAQIDSRAFVELIGKVSSPALDDLFRFLGTHLPIRGTAERPVLEKVLDSIDRFGKERQVIVAVVMDEFQEILRLERYTDAFMKDTVLGFWEGVTSGHTNTWFVITGSMIYLMEQVLLSGTSPLYGRYQQIRLRGLSEEDAFAFLMTQISRPLPAEVLRFMTVLSEGHPYLSLIGERLRHLISGKRAVDITLDDANAAAITEITEGALANHCRYLFDVSLAHARRGDSLAQILETIARSGKTTAVGIARITGQQPGTVSQLLRNLVEVDLLRKENAHHTIPNRIFRFWLESVYGLTTPSITRLRRRLVEAHDETISQLKEDRGALLESAVRELLTRFDGRKFRGRTLPVFSRVRPIYLPPSRVGIKAGASQEEIDAYCEGAESWVVEIRWRGKAVSKHDLRKFEKKRRRLEETLKIQTTALVIVSMGGFSRGAIEAEKSESGLWLIDAPKLQELFAVFGMKPLRSLANLI